MRLPALPSRVRDLAEQAADRLPFTVSAKGPTGEGLAAFDDVPCARIPVWSARTAGSGQERQSE